ncbi:odorant receptor 43a-like [Xylocopa sonorina]|uniref:odorant receptor 43a-like n=1 Tax=Xylocopa sonorina TaxID=1818115 RepID=UPI00403AA52D
MASTKRHRYTNISSTFLLFIEPYLIVDERMMILTVSLELFFFLPIFLTLSPSAATTAAFKGRKLCRRGQTFIKNGTKLCNCIAAALNVSMSPKPSLTTYKIKHTRMLLSQSLNYTFNRHDKTIIPLKIKQQIVHEISKLFPREKPSSIGKCAAHNKSRTFNISNTQAQRCTLKPTLFYYPPIVSHVSTLKLDAKMPRLRDTEEDLRHATRFLRTILGLVGAWPIPRNSSLATRIAHRMKHVIANFLLFLIIVPSLFYTFLKEKNGKMKLKLMGPIVNCSLQTSKYMVLLSQGKEIQTALDAVRQDWMDATEENRLIFLSKAKIGKRVVVMAAVTSYGAGICYRAILPLLKGTIVTPENVTIRPIACPSYFFILDEQRTPNYEILFTLQIVSGFVTYAVISGSCGIVAFLVLHVCGMLTILVNKMKRFADTTDLTEASVQRMIKDIVDYQTKINGFLKRVKTITKYICLCEVVLGSCLICVVDYSILMEWENNNIVSVVTYVTFQVSFVFSVFILCYIGQLLINENDILAEASYRMNWHRLPPWQARYTILIIAMSNHSMTLTAGNVFDVSLAAFTDVMKMSVAYLNLLRKVV